MALRVRVIVEEFDATGEHQFGVEWTGKTTGGNPLHFASEAERAIDTAKGDVSRAIGAVFGDVRELEAKKT